MPPRQPSVITYRKRRKKRTINRQKKEESPEEVRKQLKKVCQFCFSDDDNEVNYGSFFEKGNVTVHYFCMLLASGLCQNTRVSDKNGILGFLLTDIKRELNRGKRLKCYFCHHKGATIGCCVKTCKRAFHLSCGRNGGTMHQFFDSFNSYCPDHLLKQRAGEGLSQPPKRGKRCVCAVCFTAVTSYEPCDSLISPCCQKSWFHRTCIQQYAISAGLHYFKCPLCNSMKDFQSEMLQFGIYIPDQDASWEREPHAFHELLERYNVCDAAICLCPKGKKHDAGEGDFKLLVCKWCGSFGSHRACGGLVRRCRVLVCQICASIADKAAEERMQEDIKAVQSPERQTSTGLGATEDIAAQERSTIVHDEEDEDIFVDVEVMDFSVEAPLLQQQTFFPDLKIIHGIDECSVALERVEEKIPKSSHQVDLNDLPLAYLKHLNLTKKIAVGDSWRNSLKKIPEGYRRSQNSATVRAKFKSQTARVENGSKKSEAKISTTNSNSLDVQVHSHGENDQRYEDESIPCGCKSPPTLSDIGGENCISDHSLYGPPDKTMYCNSNQRGSNSDMSAFAKATVGNVEKATIRNVEKAGNGNIEKAVGLIGNVEKATNGNVEKATDGDIEKAENGNTEKAEDITGNAEKTSIGKVKETTNVYIEKATTEDVEILDSRSALLITDSQENGNESDEGLFMQFKNTCMELQPVDLNVRIPCFPAISYMCNHSLTEVKQNNNYL